MKEFTYVADQKKTSVNRFMALIEKLGGSVFLPTVLFVTCVNNVFVSNGSEFTYQTNILIACLLCFLALLCFSGGLFYFSKNTFVVKIICVFSVALGINIFIWDGVQLFLQGKSLSSSWLIAFEVFAIALTTYCLALMNSGRFNKVFFFGSLILVTFGGYAVCSKLLVFQSFFSSASSVSSSEQGSDSSTGNVYHLVLDQYQSEFWPIVTQQIRQDAMPFVYYTNFHSNDPYTQSSMSSLALGRTLQQGENPNFAWNNIYGTKESLFSRLSVSGVTVHRYPHYQHHCFGSENDCIPAVTYIEGNLPKFIDMWVWQILPPSIRSEFGNEMGQNWMPGYSLSKTLIMKGLLEPHTKYQTKPNQVLFNFGGCWMKKILGLIRVSMFTDIF